MVLLHFFLFYALFLPWFTRDIAQIASLITAGAIIGFTTTAGATATLLPDALGYYWHTSTWYTLTCNSPEEYTTSAEAGKCCDPQTACRMVDFCSDGTAFFSNDDYFTCYSYEHCATQTVYDSPDESSSVLNIGCATSLLAHTLYRRTTTPTSATSSTSTTSTYSSSATPSHSITATPGQSITASAPTATTATESSANPPPRLSVSDSDSDSGNQAWIAGAVIGPVAGCAILAGLGFWFFRRRRSKMRAEAEAAPTTAMAGDHGLKPAGGEGSSELPVSSERPISELPDRPHYELAAD